MKIRMQFLPDFIIPMSKSLIWHKD